MFLLANLFQFGKRSLCTGRETRTLKTLFLKQVRIPIPPFLHCWGNRDRTYDFHDVSVTLFHWAIPHFVLYKGIEPLSSDRKSDALSTMLIEPKFLFLWRFPIGSGFRQSLSARSSNNASIPNANCGSYENRTRISRETVEKDNHYPNEPFLYIYQDSNPNWKIRNL